MAINVFKNFGTAGSVFRGNSNIDNSSIDNFLEIEHEAQNNQLSKIREIEDSYNDLTTAYDSLNFRIDNPVQQRDLDRLKKNYGISDDIFDEITVDDIERGGVGERFKAGVVAMTQDPLYKKMVQEQLMADEFKQKISQLEATDKVMAHRAQKAYIDRYVNQAERPLLKSGFPLSMNEFETIDVDKEVAGDLAKVLKRQTLQEVDETSAPGQILVNKVSSVPGDRNVHLQVADRLLKERMKRDPRFRHNIEAKLAYNSADGNFEDSDVYNQYLDELVTDATARRIEDTVVRKAPTPSGQSSDEKKIAMTREVLKGMKGASNVDWDNVSDAVVNQWGRKTGDQQNIVKKDSETGEYYMRVGSDKIPLPTKAVSDGDGKGGGSSPTEEVTYGNVQYSFDGAPLTDSKFEEFAGVKSAVPSGVNRGVVGAKNRYKISSIDGKDYFETTSPDLAVKFGFETERPEKNKNNVNWLPGEKVFRYPVLSGNITETSALPEIENEEEEVNLPTTGADISKLAGLIDEDLFKTQFPSVYEDNKSSFADGSVFGVEKMSKIIDEIGEDDFSAKTQAYYANKKKGELLSKVGRQAPNANEETVVAEKTTPVSTVPKSFSKIDYSKTNYDLDVIKSTEHFKDMDLVHLSDYKIKYDKNQVTFPVVDKGVAKYLDLIEKDFPGSIVTGGARDLALNGDANKGKGDAGVKNSAHLRAKSLDFKKDASIGKLIGKPASDLKKYGIKKIFKHGKPLHIHVEFI